MFLVFNSPITGKPDVLEDFVTLVMFVLKAAFH